MATDSDRWITVPWEDAPFNSDDLTQDFADSAQNTFFYQTVPRVWGTYLMIPRIMGTLQPEGDIGTYPDEEVLAEGKPFVFCVAPDGSNGPPGNANCGTPKNYLELGE